MSMATREGWQPRVQKGGVNEGAARGGQALLPSQGLSTATPRTYTTSCVYDASTTPDPLRAGAATASSLSLLSLLSLSPSVPPSPSLRGSLCAALPIRGRSEDSSPRIRDHLLLPSRPRPRPVVQCSTPVLDSSSRLQARQNEARTKPERSQNIVSLQSSGLTCRPSWPPERPP